MQHGTTQTLHTYSACKTLLDKVWELEGKWGDDREGERKRKKKIYIYIYIYIFRVSPVAIRTYDPRHHTAHTHTHTHAHTHTTPHAH